MRVYKKKKEEKKRRRRRAEEIKIHPSMVPQRSIEYCTLKLQSWSPFRFPKTLDSDPKPSYSSSTGANYSKRPCRADRATSFTVDAIDMSRLSLMDDDRTVSSQNKRWFAGKRRRRTGSRSVSGRSSDRSGTRRRCYSVGASAAYGTCSDIPVTVAGTDSSGELFLNGDLNWGSDVSRERDGGAGIGIGEKETNLSSGLDTNQGNESGYGSEPGYRGDAEFGYGDEFDEEEDDQRVLFWGHQLEAESKSNNVEMVGGGGGGGGDQNTLQKAHHRCRRKKHDLRMLDPMLP